MIQGGLIGLEGSGLKLQVEEVVVNIPYTVEKYRPIYRQRVNNHVLTDMIEPLSSGCYTISFSKDGTKIVVATKSGTLVLYQWNGEKYIKLPPIESISSISILCAAISPDGTRIAVGHGLAPFVTVLELVGNKYEKMPTLPSPGSAIYSVAFSNEGNKLVVGTLYSPFGRMYKWDGQTYVLHQQLTLGGRGVNIAFSSDDEILSIAHFDSPDVAFFKYNANGYYYPLSNPLGVAGHGSAVSVSFDKSHIILTHYLGVTLYKWNGSTYAQNKLLVNATGVSVSFSGSNNTVAISHTTTASPYTSELYFYKLENSTLVLDTYQKLSTGNVEVVKFSPDDKYLAVGCSQAPYIQLYRTGNNYKYYTSLLPQTELVDNTFEVLIPLENKHANEDVKVYRIPLYK